MTAPRAKIAVSYVDSMGDDTNVVNAARVSFAKECDDLNGPEYSLEDNLKLLSYLAKHKHWSPFAHSCITVRCKVPIFLARQLVKHQVGGNWNEESRRYIDGPVEFYVPDALHMKPKHSKQGSAGVHPNSYPLLNNIEAHTDASYELYRYLIDREVAPEEARLVLPLNSMVNFVWTGSLIFFDRVVTQRMDSHAQLAAQEFARELSTVIREIYPHSYQALEAARG